jgi:transposase
MAMLGKIRRMYFRDGLSLSEISRRTSLSRNTIKKWLKRPQGTEPTYRRLPRPGKLTPYEGMLTRALETDAQRPKRDRRTALKLCAELKAQGYTGGYTLVTNFVRFVRHWYGGGGKALAHALWSQVRHPEYGELTVAEMLAHEQPSLMTMPAPFNGYVETQGGCRSRATATRCPANGSGRW